MTERARHLVFNSQRRGVGPALVRACEERARGRGKRRMDICFVSPDAVSETANIGDNFHKSLKCSMKFTQDKLGTPGKRSAIK
jgi:GNAT superfamily N-acetyltransferase